MIRYDGRADALYIDLTEGPVHSQKEVKAGVILHLGENDTFRSLEIRDASRHIPLRDLGRLVLGQSAQRGSYKAVLELPRTIDPGDFGRLIQATRADGWEVAPARRRIEAEAAIGSNGPRALLFVRRKQPARSAPLKRA